MSLRSLTTLVLFGLTAASASAQITGFDSLVWSPSGSVAGQASLTPETLTVPGPDGGLPCAGGASTGLSALVPVTAVVSVELHWFASGPCSGDAPFYAIDGLVVSPASDGQGCAPDGQQQLSFEVLAGQTLSFGVSSDDCLGGGGLALFQQFVLTPQQWVDLGAGLDPRLHKTLGGATSGPSFGASLAAVPDANADGFSEVGVGAPDHGGSGRVSLHSSSFGQQLWARSVPGRFGSALAGLDDLNGDGRGELAAGAPDAGQVYLLSGLNGQTLWQHPGDPGLRTGAALASLSDLNSDLRDELVVGQPGDGLLPSGPALVLSGLDGSVLRSLPPLPGELLFGAAVACAGDVDGDGDEDVLVGAPGVGLSAPRARVFSGATGLPLLTLVSPSGTLDSAFGTALASAGDVDGDGRPELLVGAPADIKQPGGPRLGSVTLFDGASGAALQTWWGPAHGARFGQSVAGGFDPDSDGDPDVLVGAPGLDLPWKTGAGSAQLVRALDGQVVAQFDGDAGDGLGGAVAFLGDGGGGRLPGVLLGKPSADGSGQVALLNDLIHPAGAPRLTGDGTQLAGDPFQVAVHDALPFVTVALVVGLSELAAPFKGGTMVPAPDGLFFLASDGSGGLVLPSVWPAGLPLAAPLILQAWCQDPVAPVGWSATNGLATIVP